MEENYYYAQTLKNAFKSAEQSLERRIDELNSLNVFPVPDGDTGINMFLTMRSAVASLENEHTESVAEIVPKFARGALLGARGNSGVILSQIFRGMANILEKKEYFTTLEFAKALHNAYETAYRSISKPVEGTILTVIRDVANVAVKKAKRNCNLKQLIATVTRQARATVKQTPDLLPQLKEAGVVDAGGKGLLYVFLGMKQSISAEIQHYTRNPIHTKTNKAFNIKGYGFDLQFLIEGECLNLSELRKNISKMGNSVLVVGDNNLVRVHIHTTDPQSVIDYCESKGKLKDIVQEDLDTQVLNFNTCEKRS